MSTPNRKFTMLIKTPNSMAVAVLEYLTDGYRNGLSGYKVNKSRMRESNELPIYGKSIRQRTHSLRMIHYRNALALADALKNKILNRI